jgi:hypothetical protein
MDSPEAIGNRLYKVRCLLGFGEHGQQRELANEFGFNPISYNQWETGYVPIPVEHAVHLVENVPGLTLDFIYRGDFDFLPPKLGRCLRKLPDRPPKRSRPRRSVPR